MLRNARGEGSFTKNANGTVTHRKGVGYKADGGRKTLTVTASSRAACIREMKKKEAEWEQQKELEKIDGKITLAQFCQLHLDYQVENDELKPKSIDRRECTINNQIAKYPLGKLQLQAVREEDISKHIKALMDEGKLSGESIVKVVNVINAAYNWGIARKSLQDNPLQASKDQLLKKVRKKTEKDAFEADVTVFSEEEVEKIEREALEVKANGKLKYAAGRQLMLLLYTGIRVGELLGLRWRDWDGECLVINKSISMAKNRNKSSDTENNFIPCEGTTKNQKARILVLSDKANKILQDMKDESGGDPDAFIAVTRTGKLNTASNLEHRLEVVLKNAGIEDVNGGLHTLRKTFATDLYEQGAKVEEVAAYIGDLESTTRKYYIAIRKKKGSGVDAKHVVELPMLKSGKEVWENAV